MSLLPAQTDSLLIQSTYLSRAIRVYVVDPTPAVREKPIVYLTDGAKLIEHGSLERIRQLSSDGEIGPAYFVFVSSLDPSDPAIDHRNEDFFCNPDFLQCFEEELIPAVEASLPVAFEAKDRLLVGVSFGGLNAACFAAQSRAFHNYALLSPVCYPRPQVFEAIAFSRNPSLRIFLSTGRHDAEQDVENLAALFRRRGDEVRVHVTTGGHDFANWNEQWTVCLKMFLPSEP